MQRSIWYLENLVACRRRLVRGGFGADAGRAAGDARLAAGERQIPKKNKPNLRAGELNIRESKAEEVTAYLRPNPDMTVGLDQIQPFPALNVPYRPFSYLFPLIAFDYLHEREHKRELRLESAQKATAIAQSQQLDLERTLLYNLRTAFVGTLQAKALLANGKENLDYFDRELTINRTRYKAGDIARVDLDLLVLQRVQYESDYQTALVNARTAKITLLTLLKERDAGGSFRRDRAVRIPGNHAAAGRLSYGGDRVEACRKTD